MKRALGLLFGVLGACVLTLSCGSSTALGAGGQDVDLITQIQQAPYVTAHAGIRRVESYYTLDGFTETLVYREAVRTDGLGNFAIDPLGAVQGGLADPTDFLLQQKWHEGFHFRYRDFLVRDLAAFLANFQLTSLGSVVQIAGRDALEVQVQRMDGSASYDVALDIETGLVLRYREFDAVGALFSLMEYETVDFAPELSGLPFHQPSNQEQPLDPAGTALGQLGFVPFIPKLLPDSAFRFLEASSVVDIQGNTWAKLTYTDGVETVFFLDAGPRVSKATGTPKPSSTSGADGLVSQAGIGMPEQLRCYQEGPLTVLWGEVIGHRMVLVGKASRAELTAMLESALP